MKKVYVAMSGGVDSSVSAALLKKAGFDVHGVYMRQWAPSVLGKECIWKQDRQDAMRVAAKIGIPFETWDFSKEYEKEVGKYMIDSYKKGITPNPDVMCNKVIKFGLFFDKAMKQGADFVATGHYARTSLGSFASLGDNPSLSLARQRELVTSLTSKLFLRLDPSADGAHSPRKSSLVRSVRLLKAKDKNKDQTYFLYMLKKNQLAKILFPVGGLEKPEVRKLAKKFGLENAGKKDSQGVCFVGQFDMKEFLKMHIKPKKGKIIFKGGSGHSPSARSTRSGHSDDKVIGMHDGAWYYTIGQRHGMDIKEGHGPYFVIKKDLKKNVLYVGREKDLYSIKAKIKNINWILKPEKFPALIDVRTRYRAPLVKASIKKDGTIIFKKLERAVTPGQSAVFYKGQKVLGGGIIF